MKQMAIMLEKLASAGGNNNASAMDPQVLADIAAQAGCKVADEISGELQGMGLKLDQISDAVGEALNKLAAMDQKLDGLDSKMDRNASQM
eukprot:3085270-Rhodomonas_salina.1